MQLLLVITTDTFMGKEKKKGSLSGKRVQSMYPEAVDKYWYFYNNFGNRWVLYFEHVEKTIVFFFQHYVLLMFTVGIFQS